jgi:hypothetical protein
MMPHYLAVSKLDGRAWQGRLGRCSITVRQVRQRAHAGYLNETTIGCDALNTTACDHLRVLPGDGL